MTKPPSLEDIAHDVAKAATDTVHEVADAAVAVARGPPLPKILLIIALVIGGLLVGSLLGVRYGVLLPQGRMLIAAGAEGLKLGRLGRLSVQGVEGDIWHDFRVRRLTIADEKGVWLDARNIGVTWRVMSLITRDLRVDRIAAQQITLVRRPTLAPKEKSGDLPLSIQLDSFLARVEMAPAFSYQRGVYDLNGRLTVKRGAGGLAAGLDAQSILHPGDRLHLNIDLLKSHPLMIRADAVEAKGGALAGVLGLPVDQPLSMEALAGGATATGKLHAVVSSGALQPLVVDGVWTPRGGQVEGHADLTVSSLTHGLAQRLGSQAQFNLTGEAAAGGFLRLRGRAATPTLVLGLEGLGDLQGRRTGPGGIALTATSPRLSDLTGGPTMGAARWAGRLDGKPDDWRFQGALGIANLDLGGYALPQLSGPVELIRHKGQLDLKGRVAGSGGKGAGYLLAVLGAGPTASFQIAQFADGRLALQDLQATGAGLKVSASGGRGLLGGLTLKGTAQFSNLAAAKIGATGGALANWNATQSGFGKPWIIGLDAKGEGLAMGYDQLDRLLGPAPRLKAQATLSSGEVAVSEASLDGAGMHAASAGVKTADGALRFKLDWSAEGPFTAGPLEITGHAKGTGAITGTLSEPRADLLADFNAIDLPRLPLTAAHLVMSFVRGADGSSGVMALNASSAYGPALARTAFRFPGGGLDLTDLSVDAAGAKATGSLTLRSGGASRADLSLRVGRGAFLSAGEMTGHVLITDGGSDARARLDLQIRNAVLPGQDLAIVSGRMTADGPLTRLPYDATASGESRTGKWSVNGHGQLSQTDPGWRLGFEGGGRLGRQALNTTEPAIFALNGARRSAQVRLASTDGGTIRIDARLDHDNADIKAQVEALGLGVLDEDLTGKVDATLSLTGQARVLTGDLSAKLTGARARGAEAAQGLDGTIKARLLGDQITLDSVLGNNQGLNATANLGLPAEASAWPFRIAINRQKPIRGHVFADGEVKPLWDFLVGGDRELSGHARLQGDLAGTLADLRGTGDATLGGGRFYDGATGLVLRDVELSAGMADRTINIGRASATDGHGGTLSGQGRISMVREGQSNFRLNLKAFRLIDNDLAVASATGQATLDRDSSGKVRLSGTLGIDRADVAAKPPTPSGVTPMAVTEINRPAALTRTVQGAERGGPGIALDVALKAPRRVFLKGRGLDVELSLDAHVGGTTTHPTLSGAARVVRGDYDFAGKRFAFDERGTVYLAMSPKDIRLDLSASRDDPALVAKVLIRGTAAKPEISLTSTPTLPDDEVLSQVLFGRSAAQLSPLEAAQLASALSSLAGGGGFDVIGNLRTFARLDRLALSGDAQAGVTVAGGKYLTDDVYLELAGGGRQGPSAQVEWRINRSLSLISKLAQQGDSKLAVRWRKDY